MIPTWHQSGVLAGGLRFNNCNTDPLTYYLPSDVWSQSFIVSAAGPGVQITVSPPVNAPKIIAEYELQLDQDDYINIKQYLIPW